MDRAAWTDVGLFALAQCALAAETVLVHALGAGAEPARLSLLRGLGLLAVAAGLAASRGDLRGLFRTARPRRQVLHAAAVLAMLWPLFYGLSHLPIADATALSYLRPVFVAAIATLFLAERVAPARWAALLLGFAGCLAVLGPAFAAWHAAYSASVLAAFLAAVTLTLGGRLAREEGVAPTLAWTGLLLALASLPLAAASAEPWPEEGAGWAALAGVGLSGALFMALALLAARRAPLVVLAPLDYARLPIVALLGLAVFAQVPSTATLAGSALILAAGAATVLLAARPGRPQGAKPA